MKGIKMKHETLDKKLTRIIKSDIHNPLHLAFIDEAIRRYAEQCAEERLPEGHIIHPDAWQAIAKRIIFTAQYK